MTGRTGLLRRPSISQTPDSKEKLIVKRALRKQFYPNLTLDRLKNERETNFEYLYTPLKQNIDKLPKEEKKLVDSVENLKNKLVTNNIPKRRINAYLNDTFKEKNRIELENKINSSAIIPPAKISPEIRRLLYFAHDQYRAYRENLHKRLKFEKEYLQEKETVMSQSIDKAKSVAGEVSKMIKKVEARWNSMGGKEKLVSGITLLLGFSWFMNSEKSAKMRDVLGKAFKLGVGFYAANTASKLFLDKKITDIASQNVNKFAGTHEAYTKAFDCDQEDAELMAEGIKSLSALDSMKLFKAYLRRKETYRQNPAIEDKYKELSILQTDMDGRKVWRVLSIFDSKYDIEGIYKELKAAQKKMGGDFQPPAFGDIAASAMMKNVAFKIENGKIQTMEVSPVKDEVDFEKTPRIKKSTNTWWVLTGQPYNWRMRAYFPEVYGNKKTRPEHLKHIAKYKMNADKPLSEFITDENFKRFTNGFTKLYNEKYKNNPTRPVNMYHETDENVVYATSRVSVDHKTHLDTNKAHTLAVTDAYSQSIQALKTRYLNKYTDLQRNPSRFNEYAQPVHGVFLTDRDGNYTDYVMFTRLVLPKSDASDSRSGSVEFDMRKRKEWADGSAIEMLSRTPMKSGDVIRYDEFVSIASNLGPIRKVYGQAPEPGTVEKILNAGKDVLSDLGILNLKEEAPPRGYKRTRYDTDKYRGAFETFLAKVRLSSNDKSKINKILEYYSKKYAGKGLSKEALVAYLAAKKYDAEDLRNILGEVTMPNLDIYEKVLKQSKEAVNKKSRLTRKKRKAFVANLMTGAGNEFIRACYGDEEALDNLEKMGKMLNINFRASLRALIAAFWTAPKKVYFNDHIAPLYERIADKIVDNLADKT
jgi:hypothetical protein